MTDLEPSAATMTTLRFHNYGEPADVLRLEQAPIPDPGSGRVRIRVHACGLNPADWALCRGLFAGDLPRGIGLEVSGPVDAVGAEVTDVGVGDHVLGTADYAGCASAGASDYAIMDHWTPVPAGLDLIQAAALPMAVETAFRSLENLDVGANQTILIHAAGTTVGFAAVQIALIRGATVIATAGETFADRLRGFGAKVTSYGNGMVDRVIDIAGGAIDLVLDTAPASGVLPDLISIAGGDPRHVLTITDFEAASQLGARSSLGEDATLRHDVLGEFAQLALERRFTVPVARSFGLEDWRAALDVSQSGQAHGKLVILPGRASSAG
ncbi:NADP-dependent oxidoreductase [Rhodopila sp.]|uniref:NADP-dependent oxidoreductase n=1 Tax=Rhodopila sp. TaxID=2480087 RepID=UPI003D0AA319